MSAGENVLPSMGSEYATGEGSSFISAGKEPAHAANAYGMPSADGGRARGGRVGAPAGMAKALVNGIRDWVGESGEVMGIWKGDKSRSF